MDIMDVVGLQPNEPLFYVTVGLVIILVMLVFILIIKKVIIRGVRKRLTNALIDKGIKVEEEKKPFFRKKASAAEEVDDLVNRLNEIVDQEKALKSKERAITNEIERLYKQTIQLQGVEAVETKKMEPSPALDEDIKKVLLMVDDLLENLPEEKLEEFTNSKDFELYKKVISKVKDGSS